MCKEQVIEPHVRHKSCFGRKSNTRDYKDVSVCIEAPQKNMKQVSVGILSEINLDFNLFSAYLNFLIQLNKYYSCNYF